MSEAVLRCSACGSPAERTHRFCEACGYELGIRRVALPDLGIDPTTGCTQCGGTEFDPDDYCEQCGALRTPPDRAEHDLGAVYLATDRGRVHARNEDAVAAAVLDGERGPIVAIAVCDGVSTSTDPQTASAAAARAGVAACVSALVADRPAAEAVMTGLQQAFEAVRAVAGPEGNAPSCTYVSAVLRCDADQSEITVTSVGDSRAYWLSAAPASGDPASQPLTIDDSWAQALVDAGVMDAHAAMRDPRAHALVRWLGADSEHHPADTAVRTWQVRGPGALLLCSDGLWNYLADPAGLATLALGSTPQQAARALVEYALTGGGSDNITVALAPVGTAATVSDIGGELE